MKTAIEIMKNILDNCEGTEGPDELRANTHIATTLREIEKCMKEYGKECINECIGVPSIQYQEQLKQNLP